MSSYIGQLRVGVNDYFGTVSDWMRAWDAAGLTRRETVGKCKRITAAR